jgi:catechol 2,3-dioxygenase-like lactoylglutathione lyase family enzyme
MAINLLDHCSIRTVKLEETRDFYVDVLGMTDGDRPDFDFPGNWLYVDGKAVVHLVGVDPDDPSGLEAYLGGSIDPSDLQGSGAFDHIAFRGQDAGAMLDRLKAQDVDYRERQVPGMDLFQIFVTDPNGITVELNYFGEKRAAA